LWERWDHSCWKELASYQQDLDSKRPEKGHRLAHHQMDFRSIMMEGVDGEFHFSPEGGVGDEEGSSYSTMPVNNETSVIDAEPLTFVPPSQFAAFLNLGPAGNWLTLSNRSDPNVPKAVTKPITHIEEGGVGDEEGSSYSTMPVNNETSVIDAEPLTFVPPSQFAVNTVDSNDAPSERDEVILDDRAIANKVKNQKVGTSLKIAGKRKHTDDDPDIHEFPSAKELKDSVDCHWVVAHVTPTLWKQHFKEISLEKLYDIYDKAYIRQVILDNVMNMRTYELMSTLTKDRTVCDAIQEREKEKDKAYAKLKLKCNEALQDLKNSLVLDMRAEIETLHGPVDKLHGEYSRLVLEEKKWQDRVALVAKVVPYVATKLIRSDEMGLLVALLDKTALVHSRCTTFEEVVDLKEPFEHEKMPSFRPFSKKEFDQAGDNLATALCPFLAKATADPYAPLETLLSKKPKSLRAKPAPSQLKSKPSSSKTVNPTT
nr:hypothetical protein [Tanacetum cinerariifolium]